MKKWVFTVLGPLLFVIFLLISPDGEKQVFAVIGITAWMLIWWVAEVVHLAVTALLPLLLFPLFGVMPIKEVASSYSHPIVYLFFGGFVLALALEKWKLHLRIALNIIKRTGTQSHQVLLGVMIATAFLSMWISNTATTVMMLPIVLSIINVFEENGAPKKVGFALLLGIAWAANIGGIGTLIGTPPNLIFSGYLMDHFDTEIYFSDWLIIGLPVAVILLLIAFLILKKQLPQQQAEEVSHLFEKRIQELGKPSTAEKRVGVVFALTALAWVCRPLLARIPGLENISDTSIAIVCAISLFIIPSSKKNKKALLQWNDTKNLSWGILILFGGGLAIAQGLKVSGILEIISVWLSQVEINYVILLILIMALIGIFVTELISNMALVAAILPIVAAIAASFDIPFSHLALPVTIGASCAFMLPTATPPNVIVFSSNRIQIKNMARIGFVMNVFATIMVTALVYFLAPYVI